MSFTKIAHLEDQLSKGTLLFPSLAETQITTDKTRSIPFGGLVSNVDGIISMYDFTGRIDDNAARTYRLTRSVLNAIERLSGKQFTIYWNGVGIATTVSFRSNFMSSSILLFPPREFAMASTGYERFANSGAYTVKGGYSDPISVVSSDQLAKGLPVELCQSFVKINADPSILPTDEQPAYILYAQENVCSTLGILAHIKESGVTRFDDAFAQLSGELQGFVVNNGLYDALAEAFLGF